MDTNSHAWKVEYHKLTNILPDDMVAHLSRSFWSREVLRSRTVGMGLYESPRLGLGEEVRVDTLASEKLSALFDRAAESIVKGGVILPVEVKKNILQRIFKKKKMFRIELAQNILSYVYFGRARGCLHESIKLWIILNGKTNFQPHVSLGILVWWNFCFSGKMLVYILHLKTS